MIYIFHSLYFLFSLFHSLVTSDLDLVSGALVESRRGAGLPAHEAESGNGIGRDDARAGQKSERSVRRSKDSSGSRGLDVGRFSRVTCGAITSAKVSFFLAWKFLGFFAGSQRSPSPVTTHRVHVLRYGGRAGGPAGERERDD